MAGINAIFYVLSTIPPWYLVDAWGRRPILLSGAIFGALSLFATAGFLYLDTTYTANAVVACVILFNASHGYSFGPIPWLYPPEIMPLSFRAKGASLATATNWFWNYVVGEVTPVLMDAIGYRLYIMHGCFCLMSFTLVYFTYPETKGVALEEMEVVFGDAEPRVVDDESDDEDEDGDGDRQGQGSSGAAARPISIGGNTTTTTADMQAVDNDTNNQVLSGGAAASYTTGPSQQSQHQPQTALTNLSNWVPSWVPVLGRGNQEPDYQPVPRESDGSGR